MNEPNQETIKLTTGTDQYSVVPGSSFGNEPGFNQQKGDVS
jgi:hypothetical protein